jgi:hypothetical protein
MAQNPKTVEINLFSPLGITILLVITIPILGIVTFATYFPKTWDATVIKLDLPVTITAQVHLLRHLPQLIQTVILEKWTRMACQ